MEKIEKKETEIDKFEQKIEELERIVKKLESSDLPLGEGLKEFEKGVALYRDCENILGKAEKKIALLLEKLSEDGEISFSEKDLGSELDD